MTILAIRTFPDPVLAERAQPVQEFDAKLGKLLDDMWQTMYQGAGIGLAANQVGVLQRVVVIDLGIEDGNGEDHPEPSGKIELINPIIAARCGKTVTEEGCLSIPDYREKVERSKEITVKALDRTGKPFDFQAQGLLAVCVQHEVDHLDGILFIDRLSRLKRQFFKQWLRKQEEELRE